MKEQTSVEWLVEQICGDHTEQWQKEIEQAKEMEKQQIENAYEEGYNRVAKLIEDATKQNGLNLNL
jgi:vacuolar-type H+-ATPase subunit H